MQRCMLKLGHGGKHMFIQTRAAAMSGECPSTPASVRRALKDEQKAHAAAMHPCGCGTRELEDCECEPADSELASYIAVVGDVREPAAHTIAGVTRDVPRPRGSAGDDWNDSREE